LFFTGTRVLYLAIKDPANPDGFYACAKLVTSATRSAVATFSSDGVNGTLKFVQETPFEPTKVLINIEGLALLAGGFHVHEFPVPPALSKVCVFSNSLFIPFYCFFCKLEVLVSYTSVVSLKQKFFCYYQSGPSLHTTFVARRKFS
jgi:hypothetical protein